MKGIRTMGALVDSRRTRTTSGALLELSSIANQKLLLQTELDRWTKRHAQIQTRLAEIAEKQTRLMAIVQSEADIAAANRPSHQAEPTFASPGNRVKFKEFSY